MEFDASTPKEDLPKCEPPQLKKIKMKPGEIWVVEITDLVKQMVNEKELHDDMYAFPPGSECLLAATGTIEVVGAKVEESKIEDGGTEFTLVRYTPPPRAKPLRAELARAFRSSEDASWPICPPGALALLTEREQSYQEDSESPRYTPYQGKEKHLRHIASEILKKSKHQ